MENRVFKHAFAESGESPVTRIEAAVANRFGSASVVPEELPNAGALAAINERSVCRSYLERPLDASLIALLCATALSAPSKSDLQQADIIRISAPAKRAAVNSLLAGSPWIAEAPELFVICGDGRRLRHLFAARGAEFPNEHLDAFFNATVDAAIVLATLVQAAHLAGLGTCPISEIRDHADEVSRLLELPQWVFPLAGLTAGYPRSFEPLSPRLGLEATVHVDRYDSERIDRDLAEYDERRIRERPYRHERDPDRFGKASRYGWSEDKFRQYSDVQRGGFGAFIRGRGFGLG